MKIKDGYTLRSVAGETVVVPCAGGLNFDCMISLNDTARFIWEKLESETTEEAVVNALLEEYEVDKLQAQKSVKDFIEKLKESDFLE